MRNITDKPKDTPAADSEQQRNQEEAAKNKQEDNQTVPDTTPQRPEQGPYIPPQEQTKGIP